LFRVTAACLPVVFLACASKVNVESVSSPYLEAALSAGEWLQLRAEDEAQIGIPDDLSNDSVVTAGLGAGAAGRLVFFLELFHATGDSTFLKSAEAEGAAASALSVGAPAAPGLYNGLAGVGFALTELAHVAQDSSTYRNRAVQVFERITSMAEVDQHGVRWGNSNDVLVGTAGIGLALIYAARELGRPEFLVTARGAGRALLAESEQMDRGIRWSRFTDRELDLPNFSHGTAGVAYFMAHLFAATGDSSFFAAAKQGADYLIAVADTTGGLFLVPYGIPNDGYVTQYDVGWGHGPAGTARLFYRLWQLTGDDAYRQIVEASARSIIAAGVPGTSNDTLRWAGPFGIDRRFGLAGVIPYLVDAHRLTGRQAPLDVARASADTIRAKATASEVGIHWSIPRFGFQGEGTAAYTGYFYGSAGLGLALLEIHYGETGGIPTIRLPDDPF